MKTCNTTDVPLDGIPMAYLRYIQGVSRPTYYRRTLNERYVLYVFTFPRVAREAV